MSFQVNYIKALDKYLIGCFMFVFSVLAEYSIILAINGKIRKRKQKLEQEVSSNNDTNYIWRSCNFVESNSTILYMEATLSL